MPINNILYLAQLIMNKGIDFGLSNLNQAEGDINAANQQSSICNPLTEILRQPVIYKQLPGMIRYISIDMTKIIFLEFFLAIITNNSFRF
jgi:hypothetical protein